MTIVALALIAAGAYTLWIFYGSSRSSAGGPITRTLDAKYELDVAARRTVAQINEMREQRRTGQRR